MLWSMLVWTIVLQKGLGRHPQDDPFGVPFSPTHHPERFAKSGLPLAGPFTFVLDGVQGDADFVASLFSLKRIPVETKNWDKYPKYSKSKFFLNGDFHQNTRNELFMFPSGAIKPGSYRHRECCYLCSALSQVDPESEDDQTDLLYTNWGRDSSYRSQLLGLQCQEIWAMASSWWISKVLCVSLVFYPTYIQGWLQLKSLFVWMGPLLWPRSEASRRGVPWSLETIIYDDSDW